MEKKYQGQVYAPGLLLEKEKLPIVPSSERREKIGWKKERQATEGEE